jgi:ankyrin repeat protein
VARRAALARWHDKIVQLLRDAGADFNAQGGRYGNALQAASEGGCDKVVELLLGAGASANAQDRGFGNALDAASEESHEKLSDLTLSLPPCTSFSTSSCFYALDLPSTTGNEILCVNEDSTDMPCSQLKSYFLTKQWVSAPQLFSRLTWERINVLCSNSSNQTAALVARKLLESDDKLG